MKRKSKKPLYHYCNDCKIDIEPDDENKLDEHSGHNITPVYDGDKDPSLVEEFQKKGLSLVTKKDNKEKDKRSPSKMALDLATSKIVKLVINQNSTDEVFAMIQVNSHVETIDLSSSRARYWLNDLYHRNVDSNEMHSDDFFKNVLNNIISHVQMNGTQRTRVHVRIAQLDDEIWYDLGTPDWSAIKISKEGIKIVKLDVDSPIFFRSQSLQSQVLPKENDEYALDKLVDLLKISKKDRLVFKVHLIGLFLESIPVPMMVLDGSAGSLKTTVTAAVKTIVDPSGRAKEDNVSTMSEKYDDLINQLSNRYLSSFDNVSSVDHKTSDIFCRAITGSSNPKRKLYTNQEEVIRSYMRKIVLNGIVPTLEYIDLQTRLIKYARETVNETNRMTENEFNAKFTELLPSVLGQIFIVLCKVLRIRSELMPTIKPKERCADFEVFGEIISRVLGHKENKFLDTYYDKLKQERISSQDAYPIISCIQTFMDNIEQYENTISNFYIELKTVANDLGIDIKDKYVRFPKSSNKVSHDLKIVESNLQKLGLIFEISRYNNRDGKFTKGSSIIKISQKDTQTSLGNYQNVSSPSSPSSPDANLGTKAGEDTGEDVCHQIDQCSPKQDQITHENLTGEDGEDGEDTFQTSLGQKPYFICKSHNAGPFHISESSLSSGNILKFHQKIGCKILFLTKEECDQITEYSRNGGLKPDVIRD
jgi:hypothetical protein